jgi:hypothetical protein
MNKIKEIMTAYAAALNPSEEQKEIAESRLTECIRCESWKHDGLIERCGICNCPTKGKIFTPVGPSGCPLGKWTK